MDWNFIIAFATGFAALGALMSAYYTEKAAQGQLLISLLDEYSRDQMRDDLKFLADYKNNKEMYELPLYNEILDLSRRRVKHFFFKAQRLRNAGFVNDKFMQEIRNDAGFDLFFEVIEPLETKAGLISPADKLIYEGLRKYKAKEASFNNS